MSSGAGSLKRIMRDFKNVTKDEPFENDSVVVSPKNNDYYTWELVIKGPANSPFEGGKFHLEIVFPSDYPFKAPAVKFSNKIYHPNVSEDGKVCLEGVLGCEWSPALTIRKLLSNLIEILAKPLLENPLRPEVAKVYQENLKEYTKTATEWTKKYANS